MKKTICICGGGGIGHALAGILGSRKDLNVKLLTRNPDKWAPSITVDYRGERSFEGTIESISAAPEEVVPQADVIILALPAFARKEVLAQIAPFVNASAWIGAFPGFGGFEWLAKDILGERALVFGAQRVPYICRVLNYGQKVRVSAIKDRLFIGVLPQSRTDEVKSLVEDMMQIPVTPLPNYLAVALTPSNPILHPSRLYELFKDWHEGIQYPEPTLFYEGWGDTASEVISLCDAEVQAICAKIPLDLFSVTPILRHYDSTTVQELTRKITSISAFKGIYAPMVKTDKGYIPDLGSRYFTEDIPYGLLVLRGIAGIVAVPTPMIDRLIVWAQSLLGKEYLVDGDLTGKDIVGLPLPRNFGIDSVERLMNRALY
ncbi:MAG: NAD(P)-binding domain-containing protein [Gammaproteobacteria bacterium]|nr:NAD(P)-binding domain-containing protein [Gammaproteobacteria bacterium]